LMAGGIVTGGADADATLADCLRRAWGSWTGACGEEPNKKDMGRVGCMSEVRT
jgi:hypothetical protein